MILFLDDSKLEKGNGMSDKLDPEMMGRTNPGMKGAIKNGGGGMHGNGHHPLPPDGMYHVSDGNGHGMNGFNGGTMINGMDNGNALAAALTDKVRLQLQQQVDEDLEDLLPPPPSMHDHMSTSALQQQQQSVVFNNKQGPHMVVQSPGSKVEGANKNSFGQDSSLNLPGRLPPSTCV